MRYGFGNYGLSSLFRSNTSSFYGSLGDYGSIRSGTYKKLLTSYYAKDRGTVSQTTKNSSWQNVSTSYTRLSEAKADADTLAKSANNPAFQTKDKDRLSKAVDSFVSDYNSVLESAEKSGNTNVRRNAQYMSQFTGIYDKSLAEVGITIGKDQKLSVDTEKLKSADDATIKRVFTGKNSFAAQTASRAYSISQAASRGTSSTSFYGRNGGYSNFYTNLLNSGFNWYF